MKIQVTGLFEIHNISITIGVKYDNADSNMIKIILHFNLLHHFNENTLT